MGFKASSACYGLQLRFLFAYLLLGLPAAAADLPTQAIQGATVVVSPEEVIEDATVVMHEGRITAVGSASKVRIPADAQVHDGTGLYVYAGFIESWSEVELALGELPERDGTDADPGRPGPSSPNVRMHPELRVVDGFVLDEKRRASLRKAGFTVAAMMPKVGVLRGTATLVHLGDGTPRESILEAEAGVVASFRPARRGPDRYPGSTMGAIAAIRQALFDAEFHAAQKKRGKAEYNPSADALLPVLDKTQPMFFDTNAVVLYPRAAEICDNHSVRGVLLGNGHEWRRPEFVPDELGLILPLNFPAKPEVADESDWVQVSLDELRHWQWAPKTPAILLEQGKSFAVTTHGLAEPDDLFSKLREAQKHGFGFDAAVAALTTEPAALLGLEDEWGTIEKGKRAYLTVMRGGDLMSEDAEPILLFVDGQPIRLETKPAKKDKPKKEKEEEAEEETPVVARHPRDDRGAYESPKSVLVRNATIWTSGPQGVLEDTDMLVRDGLIAELGKGLSAPADAMVIDGAGKHITAGLIDPHSHIAAIGGLNEGTVSASAEVRVRDVINSEDRRIYEQLAGGLTTSHILHGSANAIGGQCQAIKLRWGATPDGLLFKEARPTIKFALGENPKRGNSHQPEWGHRYPRTRLGVDDFIRESFVKALTYKERFAMGEVARNLRNDALLEILADERDIHCHSYRQDEILMLMRLMESFDARVAVFTHVLEGYKVADELAKHGAGASTFADWWAYKLEVYDAIPQNTTIMEERAVSVSVNSDSADLARRMNREAAKSVRHGGTDAETALKFVTINAAEHIGAQHLIGSIEEGKQADFVLWSAAPFAATALAEQTWIEGSLYFDRALDHERQAKITAEYDALVTATKGKDNDEEAETPSEGAGDAGSLYRYEMPAELEWASRELGCNDLHNHQSNGQEVNQ